MTRAVYPGSFDPLTLGHLDLIRRGAAVFDELVVAVARNVGKQPIFAAEERVDCIREVTGNLRNVRVEQFDGMTVDFARQQGCSVILRGLRTMADFEYESQLAFTNRMLAPEIDTVLMMTSHEYAFISSRWIKEAAICGSDVGAFVPPHVAELLKKRLRGQRQTGDPVGPPKPP
jgi:pantetheine-phosphate adenylyltransferase